MCCSWVEVGGCCRIIACFLNSLLVNSNSYPDAVITTDIHTHTHLPPPFTTVTLPYAWHSPQHSTTQGLGVRGEGLAVNASPAYGGRGNASRQAALELGTGANCDTLLHYWVHLNLWWLTSCEYETGSSLPSQASVSLFVFFLNKGCG